MKKKKTILRWLGGGLGALVLLGGAAWVGLFHVNKFSLEVELLGQPTLKQEYGEPYEEPGAKLWLRGTLLCRDGIELERPVEITGRVNANELGRYTVCYSGKLGPWQARALRKVNVMDTQCPVITLTQDPPGSLQPGKPYQEAGYQATDNLDGDITSRVIRQEVPGKVTYSVIDSSGNPAVVEREIPYFDNRPPEIHLEGGTDYAIPLGAFYTDPGYTAQDDVDGNLTAQVQVEGEVDPFAAGTYPVVYTVTDSYQNVATVTRNVQVTAQPRPETVWPEGKTIYLTFDDGPGPYTSQLLDVLDRYGVKATFFVTDSGYDQAMKEIVDRGHSIGIHTVSHRYDEIYTSPEAYFGDLMQMQDIIYRNTGVKTTLLRFPGGSSNEISRRSCEGIMTTLVEAVQDAGFQYFDWNVDSNDAGGARKSQQVFDNVVAGVKNARVSMVLQHDIHAFSVEAVEDILAWGLDHGYTFRAIDPTSPGFHHGLHN